MVNLKNDYNTIGDKLILEELINKCSNKYVGYGTDEETKKLNDLVKKLCNMDVDSYVLSGGTITNVIGLSEMLKYPYEAVIAVDSSHINVHETGAIEATGHKIIYTPKIGGKIDISKIEETYNKFTDNHMVLPKALYISNATELGEVYTLDELKEISKICKKLNLYFFIDGARLPIALVASKYNISDIASLADMFYIGGTKNGLPFGELLIITNNELKEHFNYLIKNRLGMLAKGFIGAIMFNKYLSDNYYLKLAKSANDMADLLRLELKDYIIYPNNTNQVFIKLDNKKVDEIKDKIAFEIWEELHGFKIIRLVSSYNTKKEEILEAIKIIKG